MRIMLGDIEMAKEKIEEKMKEQVKEERVDKEIKAKREKRRRDGRYPIYDLVFMALFAAVICVVAPFSIPFGAIPVSLTNFVLYFSLYFLGWKKGMVTYLVYLLIGTSGFPVFSGFTGGISKLAGPTGGYLIGFIALMIIAGWFIEHFPRNIWLCILGMVLGTVITYGIGTFWFCFSTQTTVSQALIVCVIPFLPWDLIKIVFTACIAPRFITKIRIS